MMKSARERSPMRLLIEVVRFMMVGCVRLLIFCSTERCTTRSFRCILDVGFQLGTPAAVECVDTYRTLVAWRIRIIGHDLIGCCSYWLCNATLDADVADTCDGETHFVGNNLEDTVL